MNKFLLSLALLLAPLAAQASMIWMAVAVEPAQVDRLRRDEELLARTLFQSKGEQSLNLDKAWHGMHYLLNGTEWRPKSTAGQAILGGKEFGPELGYGRARILSPGEVKAIAEALAKELPEALSTRYDAQAMETAQIYPSIWQREGPEGLRFLMRYYEPLRAFYQRAAEKGQAVVIAII